MQALLILALLTSSALAVFSSDESSDEYDSIDSASESLTDDDLEAERDSDSTVRSLDDCSDCEIPMTKENWLASWDSLSRFTKEEGMNVLVLEPKHVRRKEDTSSVVFYSKKVTSNNFILEVECKTGKSTRDGHERNANQWEVFWLTFNGKTYPRYGGHVMKSWNVFMMKPQGYQVSVGWDGWHERFLASGPNIMLKRDRYYRYYVYKFGKTITVAGKDLLTGSKFEKTVTSDDIYDQEGQIGLYTEDALVTCRSVKLKDLANVHVSADVSHIIHQ